jgi:hypothetical protein
MANAKLTLADIADLRAYERERDEFRAQVVELKRRRRLSVGPLISLVFENAQTVRFQIQEMARAERLHTDEQIQTELDTYNSLIPEPGQLSATMFLELTTKAQLVEWLPKLVGIERSVVLVIGHQDPDRVRSQPEAEHEAALTREETTASVHYVHFEFSRPQIVRFAAEPVALEIDHPAYQERCELSQETKMTLLDDLRG